MSRSSRKQGLSVFFDIYNRISTKKGLKNINHHQNQFKI